MVVVGFEYTCSHKQREILKMLSSIITPNYHWDKERGIGGKKKGLKKKKAQT